VPFWRAGGFGKSFIRFAAAAKGDVRWAAEDLLDGT
jgi:hypothetical protein